MSVFGVKKEVGQLNNQSKTFCMHPFTGLATREDGAIKACCRSLPVGYIQDNTLEEIWNNDTMRRIRSQVLSNERPPECEPCFMLEDQGVESLRQRHIKGEIPEARINLYPRALDNLHPEMSLPFEFPTMEIKLNNLCNLKCRMCHPMDSTSWNDWDQVVSFYKKENNFLVEKIDSLNLVNKPYLGPFDDSDNWWKSFEKLLPHFKRVEFAGGEPLMDPQHFKILEMLKPYGKDIQLKYATNLTMLGKGNRTVHEYWPHFKSIAVNVSIDGYGPSYEYIRGNASWIELIHNIEEIQKFPNIDRIVGAVAVQVSNAWVLPRMIEFFLENLGIVFYVNMVKYPECLSVQALPNEFKKQVTERLLHARDRIHSYSLVKKHPILQGITETQIDNIINYTNNKDRHDELWNDTINFNMNLDITRNQSFIDVNPELKPYV
jgi:molybdenum cofactor biosynthesis enzyme MoaA